MWCSESHAALRAVGGKAAWSVLLGRAVRQEVAVPDLGPGSQRSLCALDWHSWSICHFVSVLCFRECFLWDCLSSALGFIDGPCSVLGNQPYEET